MSRSHRPVSALLALAALLSPACVEVRAPNVPVVDVVDGTPSPSEDIPAKKARAFDDGGLLDTLGFAAAAASDDDPVGAVSATFTAPITTFDTFEGALGASSLTVDDETRAVAALAIADAYSDDDLFYVVLFDEFATWQYVVIATRASALAPGDLALDGELAVAVVIDENTGEGTIALDGALHIDAVDLSAGHIEGSLASALFPVSLASWPQDLLPLTDDGEPLDEVALTASGAFSAVVSTGEEFTSTGVASVSVSVDGAPAVFLSEAMAVSRSGELVVLVDDFASGTTLGVWLLSGAPTVGTHAIGGSDVRVVVYGADGSAVEALSGTLTLDAVSLDDGAPVSGSVAIDGLALVYPEDDFTDPDQPSTCEGLDAAVDGLAPTIGALYTVGPDEGFPPGFDRVLILWDETLGAGVQVLLADDADLALGVDLAPVVVEGRLMPLAVIVRDGCEEPAFVDGGALSATLSETSLSGSLSYTVGATARTIALDVALSE